MEVGALGLLWCGRHSPRPRNKHVKEGKCNYYMHIIHLLVSSTVYPPADDELCPPRGSAKLIRPNWSWHWDHISSAHCPYIFSLHFTRSTAAAPSAFRSLYSHPFTHPHLSFLTHIRACQYTLTPEPAARALPLDHNVLHGSSSNFSQWEQGNIHQPSNTSRHEHYFKANCPSCHDLGLLNPSISSIDACFIPTPSPGKTISSILASPTWALYNPLPSIHNNSHIMKTHTQVANSLSEFHWLFSDEQPVESLPLFYPRVLNC